MPLKLLFSLLTLVLMTQTSLAKEWRGIVPLRSTRADVERRFGKPDKWGNYEFKDERVSFRYGGGHCKGFYLTLGEDNCKCLLNKDTVMAIDVEPTGKRKISDLKLDMKKFRRTPINPFPHTFEYDNVAEGITYIVDEPEDEIRSIEYYASSDDCGDIINKRAPRYRNVWRGLRPLHSTRKDVEALFGSPDRDWQASASYETDHESIVAKYSNGSCDAAGTDWKVPKSTLIELSVNPNPSFLLKELHIDLQRYQRYEIFPYPETDNPPKVWNYIDDKNGITIRAQSSRGGGEGEEIVVSITYQPATKDEHLRCPKGGRPSGKKH